MRLHTSTWPEVETYLTRSTGIIIPIGSTEQHGPTGLVGCDAICAEEIAWEGGRRGDFLVAPTFNVGSAQHHMAFPGTMTLRPSTMIAVISDWVHSLSSHGFSRIYFLNGHGGNIAPVHTAFAEIYARRALDGDKADFVMKLQNWFDLPGIEKMTDELYPVGAGSHATAAEISVTFAAYPEKQDSRILDPKVAPEGSISDKNRFRKDFPDGRIGSDPSQSNIADGKSLIDVAAAAMVDDVNVFFNS